jgi:hypothetical protein
LLDIEHEDQLDVEKLSEVLRHLESLGKLDTINIDLITVIPKRWWELTVGNWVEGYADTGYEIASISGREF